MLRGEEFSGCLWMTQVSPESRVARRNRPLVSLSGFIARRRCVWAVMTVVLLIAPPPPPCFCFYILVSCFPPQSLFRDELTPTWSILWVVIVPPL